MIAVAFPISKITSPLCILCIKAVNTSPTLSLYSSNTASFSNSLIFCKTTCFAACAAILPKSSEGISICTVSPISTFGEIYSASERAISNSSSLTFSTTVLFANNLNSPFSLSTSAERLSPTLFPSSSLVVPNFSFLYAVSIASSKASNTFSLSKPLSAAICVTAERKSVVIAITKYY